MVNYNHEDTIKETIESVLMQTYQNIQFIIVDDGSTDESCKVIESIDDSRIEVYKFTENRHICHATNFGMEMVKGEYLARIDSDDLWHPDKLSRQLEFLNENPEYKVCFTQVAIIDSKGTRMEDCALEKIFATSYEKQEEYLEHFFFHGNFLSHPSVLMKTEIMQEIGKFHVGYMQAHDFDYWVRIGKRYPMYVLQEKLVSMRRFDVDEKATNNSCESEINTTRFYNEFIDIRMHFFDDLDDNIFCSTFQKYFKNKDSSNKEELECEKAFLLCTPYGVEQTIPAEGIQRLMSLFEKEEYADILETKYHFTAKDFYKLTRYHLYNDRLIEQKNELLERRVKSLEMIELNLRDQINQQEQIIQEYENSTSWKITRPFRNLMWKIKN